MQIISAQQIEQFWCLENYELFVSAEKQLADPLFSSYSEGDEIKSKLPFKIFSTLSKKSWNSGIQNFWNNVELNSTKSHNILEFERILEFIFDSKMGLAPLWIQN